MCEKCDEINHFRTIPCISCGGNFGKKPGRPQKTTQLDGFSVGRNGGRPHGTTRQAGNAVSGHRPCGTTRLAGNAVSRGRPRNTRRCPEFHNTIQLPTNWDHSNNL